MGFCEKICGVKDEYGEEIRSIDLEKCDFNRESIKWETYYTERDRVWIRSRKLRLTRNNRGRIENVDCNFQILYTSPKFMNRLIIMIENDENEILWRMIPDEIKYKRTGLLTKAAK